ncbi:hypothetical protein FRB94_003375 [Tulasnella sp. JGI-2019a]|nr:hypothetical protein FRB93_007944 [Tulasnella sp. JGI-2019a]KAG9003114.1 hypothetical protein FRB94_003375 [Tulasnella sp. JGI-2019a]KAG9028752.1 hypothetical protein FRB95_006120 [Tulasnella sp. JGI-2019a]
MNAHVGLTEVAKRLPSRESIQQSLVSVLSDFANAHGVDKKSMSEGWCGRFGPLQGSATDIAAKILSEGSFSHIYREANVNGCYGVRMKAPARVAKRSMRGTAAPTLSSILSEVISWYHSHRPNQYGLVGYQAAFIEN